MILQLLTYLLYLAGFILVLYCVVALCLEARIYHAECVLDEKYKRLGVQGIKDEIEKEAKAQCEKFRNELRDTHAFLKDRIEGSFSRVIQDERQNLKDFIELEIDKKLKKLASLKSSNNSK